MKPRTKKLLIGSAAALTIGILGSALFSYIFDPMFSWVGRSVLTLLTLGIDSIKNSIYAQIARGYTELPSLYVEFILSILLLGVSAVLAIRPFVRIIARRYIDRKIAKVKADAMQAGSGSIGETVNAALNQELVYQEKKLIKHEISAGMWAFCIAGFFFARFLIVDYTNRAIANYKQSFAICRPYLDSSDEEKIESRFAQIKTRDDYALILSDLDRVARTNGVEIPKFDAW